ncbi:MAG: RluA family pseudouridine synthase [Candidatus Eisenbacteria bacterium]|nr:RluA family pseudouridine synthase [Candidatus Eisenbacteria bacterium]
MHSLRVDEESEGQRIDRFLAELLTDLSRSRIQALIRAGRIRIDGTPCKPSTPLVAGQRITWPTDAGWRAPELVPEPIDLPVLFEDDDLLVLHKPAGLVVHPAPGHWSGTLVHALLHRWPAWRAPGGPLRPGIVHRLDRDTSGLMVVARSSRAYYSLREQIAARRAGRAYVALVWGTIGGTAGIIDRPIGRDPRARQRMAVRARGGRPARTIWRVLWRFDSLTLLRLLLRTGRTHQVRVHLSDWGHPVFADPLYGGVQPAAQMAPAARRRAETWVRQLGRQALHAYRLSFRHPADGAPLVFEAPVPADMERILLEVADSGGADEHFDANGR